MQSIRTDETREKFIAALADCGNVTRACEKAGIGRMTAYEWRRADPDFAAAWEGALRICTRNNPAFRTQLDTESDVGPVSPCRADALRRHLERRWFTTNIWIAMILRRLVTKTLIDRGIYSRTASDARPGRAGG